MNGVRFIAMLLALVLSGIACVGSPEAPAAASVAPLALPPPDDDCSFAVLADPRHHGATWRNALRALRDGETAGDTSPRPDFILLAGDYDPAADRFADYLEIFPDPATRPVLLPVIGNHEFDREGEGVRFTFERILPTVPIAARRSPASGDYCFDRDNTRVIVVDAYHDLGKRGTLNDSAVAWVRSMIDGAPAHVRHVFVALHDPPFPRIRHVGDSADEDPVTRDAFWRMLVERRGKVRAVFTGHTHFYYRMRVADPAGPASDGVSFPDEDGGIYQVDAGAAGNGDSCTIVRVRANGGALTCRVFQAEAGERRPFRVVDGWCSPDGDGHY